MKRVATLLIIIFTISLITIPVLGVTGTVNTQDLNLRDGASTSNTNIIMKLDKNTNLDILEENGEWYKVKYQDIVGYVNKRYVEKNEENNTPNTDGDEDTNIDTDIPSSSNDESKILSNATVYVLPLLNSSKIGTLSENTNVTIISDVGNWKYIQTSSISGWVIASKVQGTVNSEKPEENEAQEPVPETTNNEINNEQTNNVENNVVSNNENNQAEEYPKTLYVNVDAVNVRENASTSSEIVGSVELNTQVKVVGEKEDWYKVELSAGSGYIKKMYLSNEKK